MKQLVIINSSALIISFTDIEFALRIIVLLASIVYTTIKIIEAIYKLKK